MGASSSEKLYLQQSRRHNDSKLLSKRSFLHELQPVIAKLLPLVYTPLNISCFIITLNMVELLAQALPENIELGSQTMSIIHSFLKFFNFRLYSTSARLALLYLGSCVNSAIILSFLTLLKLNEKIYSIIPAVRKALTYPCCWAIQYYILALTVPFLNMAFAEILRPKEQLPLSRLIVSGFLITSTVLISFLINKWDINIGYSKINHLAIYPSAWRSLRLMVFWLSPLIFFQDNFFNGFIAVCIFLLLLLEYLLIIPYSSVPVSKLYFTLIFIGLCTSFCYAIILYDYKVQNHIDFSLFIGLSITLSLRLSDGMRKLLIAFKLFKKSITSLTSPVELDLLIREIKELLHQDQRGNNLEARSELMNLILKHKKNCTDEANCPCADLCSKGNINWSDAKRVLMKDVGRSFAVNLEGRWGNEKEAILLTYCFFLIDMEGQPKKALSMIYKNENRLESLKGRILKDIILAKCIKITENQLKNITSDQSNFSDLILHESEAFRTDVKAKLFLLRFLVFAVRIQPSRNDAGEDYSLFALIRGAALIQEQKVLKAEITQLLNQNPENLRILSIAARLHSLFEDDLDFFSLIKGVEQRRLHIARKREKIAFSEKQGVLDIFNPNSGVIYINLSKKLGFVEKASVSALNLLRAKREDLVGHNISKFMPKLISKQHDNLLKKFIDSDKSALIREKSVLIFAIDTSNYLIVVNLNLRIDTFFKDTFLMSGLITKTVDTKYSLICDEAGEILHYTHELDAKLGLKTISERIKNHFFNICVLIPQLYWNIHPDGKENSQETELELLDIDVLLVSPAEVFDRKSIYLRGIERDQDTHTTLKTGFDERSPRRLKKEDTPGLKDFLFEQITQNLLNPEACYRVKLDLRTVKYDDGKIKFIYLNFITIGILAANDPKKNLKLEAIKSSFFESKKNTAFPLLCFGKNLQQTNEESDFQFTNKSEASAEENLKDEEEHDIKSSRLKNNMKSYQVLLPNSPKIELAHHHNLLNIEASNLMVPTNDLRINLPVVEEKKATLDLGKVHGKLDKRLNKKPQEDYENKSLPPISSGYQASNKLNINRKEQVENIIDGNRSENSSSVSSGSFLIRINALENSKTKEAQILIFLRFILIALIMIIMIFTLSFMNTKSEQIFESLNSSHILQDAIMPFTLLVKNFIIAEMKGQNLFNNEAQEIKELFEYIDVIQQISRDDEDHALKKQLVGDPETSNYLFKRRIQMIIPNFGDYSQTRYSDLRSSLAILYSYLTELQFSAYSEEEAQNSRDYVLKNIRTFLKEFSLTYEDIITDVFSMVGACKNLTLYTILTLSPFLFLTYLFVLRCGYKIKDNSQRFSFALRNFDKLALSHLISEVSNAIIELYPSELLRVKFISGEKNLGKQESASNYKVSEHHKNPKDRAKPQEGLKAQETKMTDKEERELDTDPDNTKLARPRTFIVLLVIGLTLIFAVPMAVFILNQLLISEFDTFLQRIAVTKEGIQIFSFSVMNKITLKHVDYYLQTQPSKIDIISDREQLNLYIDTLSKEISIQTNTQKVLDKEEAYPELTNLNTEFYFEDVCQTLSQRNLSIDFTGKFNFKLCEDMFQGILKRGLRLLVMEIDNMFIEWDYAFQTMNDPKETLRSKVLNTPFFSQLQYVLNIINVLEEDQLNKVSRYQRDYINTFQQKEMAWLVVGLGVILIIMLIFWFYFLKALDKTYLSSILMLKNFPSRMISSNKVLLARMDVLFKKA